MLPDVKDSPQMGFQKSPPKKSKSSSKIDFSFLLQKRSWDTWVVWVGLLLAKNMFFLALSLYGELENLEELLGSYGGSHTLSI